MATLAASIALQIAALDDRLAAIAATSVSADGVSASHPDWVKLSDQRMKLQQMYDRITGSAPMFVRGRVSGLGS